MERIIKYVVMDGEKQVKFYCKLCKKWHRHGFDKEILSEEGSHRVTHCRDGVDYYLKIKRELRFDGISPKNKKMKVHKMKPLPMSLMSKAK